MDFRRFGVLDGSSWPTPRGVGDAYSGLERPAEPGFDTEPEVEAPAVPRVISPPRPRPRLSRDVAAPIVGVPLTIDDPIVIPDRPAPEPVVAAAPAVPTTPRRSASPTPRPRPRSRSRLRQLAPWVGALALVVIVGLGWRAQQGSGTPAAGTDDVEFSLDTATSTPDGAPQPPVSSAEAPVSSEAYVRKGSQPEPPVAPVVPEPPATEATTMRTALTIDGVEIGAGFVDLRTGNLSITSAAPFVYSGETAIDAVDVRAIDGTTFLSVPAARQSLTAGLPWIELAASGVTVTNPTPLGRLLAAGPGARLAVVVAGTNASEAEFGRETIRGVETIHRRETVDLDLADRRLAQTGASAVVIQMRNELGGSPLVADVWRDAAGTPLRIVVAYPAGDAVGYLMADLAEPGVASAWEPPPAASVAWTTAGSVGSDDGTRDTEGE